MHVMLVQVPHFGQSLILKLIKNIKILFKDKIKNNFAKNIHFFPLQ